MTEESAERWHYTLWSRGGRNGLNWTKDAEHREERCWELAGAGRADDPDAEWLVLPPGETPYRVEVT